jgi:uncharacterized protein (TIGR03067 family)
MRVVGRIIVLSVAFSAFAFAAAAAPALEGSWTVARATVDGVARADGKVLNATWTFHGAELVVENAHGERLRATLSFDAGADPPAFHVDAPGERPLWMIWAQRDGELHVAFYDGVDRRPEDFGPRHKLVVLTLVPARRTAAPMERDPCDVLRVAGVERLLGGPTQARPTTERRASIPGRMCALDRTDGSKAISLTLVAPPAGPAYVEAARREADADRRMQIGEEPTLGAGAFSGARGWTTIVVAHRHGTAMVLKFEALGAERNEVRRFAARVLDAL